MCTKSRSPGAPGTAMLGLIPKQISGFSPTIPSANLAEPSAACS